MVNKTPKPAVSGFSQEWLSLREPADRAARSLALSESLRSWAKSRSPLHVMDFGTGTGSNLRYLCPLLGHDQQWTLVDNDAQLLTHLPDLLAQWATANGLKAQRLPDMLSLSNEDFSASVRWQQADLANALPELPFATSDLVTGSALLDLTSRRWLEQLAGLCTEHGCASFFVLNYEGRIEWQPAMEGDSLMRQLLNIHQLNDKGFGPALGPEAGHYFASLLDRRQEVAVASSEWALSSTQASLQAALIKGWSEAAIEQQADQQCVIEQWQAARQSYNAKSMSQLTVGHVDVLALPSQDA